MSLALLLAGMAGLGQITVYDDALAPGWVSWSWNGRYDFASPALADGAAAIACDAAGWGALSVHGDTTFGLAAGHSGLRFRFAGPGDGVVLVLEADGEGASSEHLLLSGLGEVGPDALTEITVDLALLGPHAWTRIDFMDATGNGAQFVVDDIALLTGDLGPAGYTAAEPVGPARIMVLGGGEPDTLRVEQGGVPVGVLQAQTFEAPARVYLDLATPLVAGDLSVCDAARCFDTTLTVAAARLADAPTHDISPDIYGIAVPSDIGAAVAETGATVVRWGGNAVSLYDPIGHFTNAGRDWFFENRDGGDAVAWLDAVHAAGARSAFTVPVLDWVARDDRSCAFPEALYGPQQSRDPYGRDCGNGLDLVGNPVRGNDPADHARPWDAEQGLAWMRSVARPPDFAFAGNELDIAGDTHRDVHPDPTTYDELLDRFLSWGTAIKAAWPQTQVAGPSSCCWWYYWNSAAGPEDKRAHGGEDLLPWLLDAIAAADDRDGMRRLDVLDVHYYPDGVFSDAVDAATRARRLRSTRSLWDPTYVDEGWIGVDQWATDRQPSRNTVMLLPRLRALLDLHYPGTGLGVTEWNWGAEADLSGGLAVADVLGIYGREGLDLATYWTTPEAGTPAAAAFALYRGFGVHALPATGFDPDRLGVFAATDDDGAHTVVVVNKDPDAAVWLEVPGLRGRARPQRFGGALPGVRVDEPEQVVDGVLVVPAYSAMFVRVLDEVPPPDADAGLPDAAVLGPVADARATTPDAAAFTPEAAVATPDAAVVTPDAAPVPPPDAAVTPPDATVATPDATPPSVVDAETHAPEADAEPEADTGTEPPKSGSKGGGCQSTPGAPRTPAALGLLPLLALLPGLRRRRQSSSRAIRMSA
jgi:MYXO-CTERM domain-containing protein